MITAIGQKWQWFPKTGSMPSLVWVPDTSIVVLEFGLKPSFEPAHNL